VLNKNNSKPGKYFEKLCLFISYFQFFSIVPIGTNLRMLLCDLNVTAKVGTYRRSFYLLECHFPLGATAKMWPLALFRRCIPWRLIDRQNTPKVLATTYMIVKRYSYLRSLPCELERRCLVVKYGRLGRWKVRVFPKFAPLQT